MGKHIRIGRVIIGTVKRGRGRPAPGDILIKRGTRATGKRGGADRRTKG